MSTTYSLPELYRPIAAPLELVRQTIQRLWMDALRLVKIELGDNSLPGGKMLRPALCLLSAGAIGAHDLKKYVALAASFEALHLASLAHDDVIDKAILRRGSTALNALWDNHAAVLGGDYMVARAVEMLATYDSCPVIANAIASVRLMAEGELLFFGRSHDTLREQDCLQLARQKTASLFAEACSAPCYTMGGKYRNIFHRFGENLGIAFQVMDDVLDLTQSEAQLGKPACGDIVEGKLTLPILYLRQALMADDLARFSALHGQPLSNADRLWIQQMLEATGARDKAHAVAQHYSAQALHQLESLPPSPYRDSIEGIVDFLQTRSS
ncbi:MAG: polyprenyl synthetase family protein [Candidatus Hydrogenedentes bacterium]|nr:polyprenyl synthetase family protein [Candidatus Hydrogenedentota bacterium]MBI3117112.1 polyprenyl synthetase family protein [Candidatus Hydrogenedentota bacterium]